MIDSSCFCFLSPFLWILDCDPFRAGVLWEPFHIIPLKPILSALLPRQKEAQMTISENSKGLILAMASSAFIGSSFILKKKGLKRAGATGARAGLWLPPTNYYYYYYYFQFLFLGFGIAFSLNWIAWFLDVQSICFFVAIWSILNFFFFLYCVLCPVRLLGGQGSFFLVNLCQNFWVG